MGTVLDTLRKLADRQKSVSPDNEKNERDEIIPRTPRGRSVAPWSPADWRDFYEERAAIRQHDAHYTKAEAERLAHGEAAVRWHKLHGERTPADLCAGCRRAIDNSKVVTLPLGKRVHDSAGHDCLCAFGKRWRAAAAEALLEFGIPAPPADEE